MVSDQGETFMPMVSRDGSDKVTGITGAVWSDASGASATVYFDPTTGLPTEAVLGNNIYLMTNWNLTAQTVDIAVISGSYINVFKGVALSGSATAGADLTALTAALTPSVSVAESDGIAKSGFCFPGCDSDAKNLAQLVKVAGLGFSVSACGLAIVATGGAIIGFVVMMILDVALS